MNKKRGELKRGKNKFRVYNFNRKKSRVKNVPRMVYFFSQEYNNYKKNNYINLPVVNENVGDAVVSGMKR
jgi:hypothetical protein